jgi:hypothetical protein
MTPKRVIGISGYARSGKDEVANILCRDYGYHQRSFGDPVKEVASAIGWNGEKDVTGRALLQDLGLAVRAHVHEDAWIWPVMRKRPRLLVVPSVRYWNEAESIKAVGGVVVRVSRPGVGPANDHVSETAMDLWPFDARIFNNGSLDDLTDRVARSLYEFL